jgi:thiol-disulfide isomerase/thioredoxin
LVLAGGLRSPGQGPAAGRATPPETPEILKAERIADPAVRLKELFRIRSAYPRTGQAARLESDILETRIDLAASVEAVVALQKAAVGQGRGASRMTIFSQAAARILDHPRFAAFDRDRVLAAVLDYRTRAERAAAEPETFASMPDPEDQRQFTARTLRDFSILVARARANAGDGEKAVAALDEYRAAGGEAGPEYFEAYGDACAALGRTRDAYGLYMSAAVENHPGAAAKAKAAYVEIHGDAEGFEARLERLQSALPFRPKPFTHPKHWRGKTVMVEVFTNSENPLCLASDLAVSALSEAYPARYLAVLEYHVPLPRPDPLMNPAAEMRRDQYRVTTTPTAVIDGGTRIFGGGTRAMAESRFEQLKAQIDAWLPEEPDLRLKARAVRTGDRIEAETSFKRGRPGADHYVALVQARERLKGSSGTILHRLIVRSLVQIDPARDKTVVFDLAGIERTNEAFLAEFERTGARTPGFTFPDRRTAIDREGLRVVYFVQDMGSRRILNAVVAEVESR